MDRKQQDHKSPAIEDGAYLSGVEEDGIVVLLVIRADVEHGARMGAVLVDLGGQGIRDIFLYDDVEWDRLKQVLLPAFSSAGVPFERIGSEAAGTRLAIAERVTSRRGYDIPLGLEGIYELLGKRAREARERTFRQLDEERALASLPAKVLRALLKSRLFELYKEWLDRSSPELNGLTPREAWRDRNSRRKVEELLHEVLQIEEMRMRAIGIAFDAERLRVSLELGDMLSDNLGAVEEEVSEVLFLAGVPPDSRRLVYEGWRAYLEHYVPTIRNPKPWAAALYKVMQKKARLVPLDMNELCRLFGVNKSYTVRLARKMGKVI